MGLRHLHRTRPNTSSAIKRRCRGSNDEEFMPVEDIDHEDDVEILEETNENEDNSESHDIIVIDD